MSHDPQQSIDSPCVGICDTGGTELCHGCFRSLDEIGGWSQAGDEQKRRIIERAQQRRRMAPADVQVIESAPETR